MLALRIVTRGFRGASAPLVAGSSRAVHLTQHTEYALRLLMYLAIHPDEMPNVGSVSAAFGISDNHLATIGNELVNAGYLEAKRGRGGGFRLARVPDQIRVGEVVRRLENLRLVECFDAERNSCPLMGPCKLAQVLDDAQRAFLETLDRVTLADLVTNRPQLLSALTLKRGVERA